MIDTAEETTCKACGKPLVQIAGRGHRQRLYCDDTCRQRAHRKRQEPQHTASVTPGVTFDEQELARYREIAALMDRAKMEARFMELGEQVQYQTLTTLTILGGYGYWFDFMKRAKDEDLLKAIAAAEYYLEGLIALRGDPRERRIADLERQVKDLQAGRDVEERFLTDTRKRDFKAWIRSHLQPSDTTFFKRFLDDREMPSSGSRSLYEARLQLHKDRYSEEGILLFRDAWKRMLFNQS